VDTDELASARRPLQETPSVYAGSGHENFGRITEWVDSKTGLPVQYDFVDANGALTGRQQLTSYR
jgi:hypothetical protein